MVVGLSTGWVPATVAESYPPAADSPGAANGSCAGSVLVFLHGRFADGMWWPGHGDHPDKGAVDGMYWRVPRAHVRLMDFPQPVTVLSLLVVRHWQYTAVRQEARSHNVLHEGLVLDALDAPHQAFGQAGSYEVYSAFIRVSEDRIAPHRLHRQVRAGEAQSARHGQLNLRETPSPPVRWCWPRSGGARRPWEQGYLPLQLCSFPASCRAGASGGGIGLCWLPWREHGRSAVRPSWVRLLQAHGSDKVRRSGAPDC